MLTENDLDEECYASPVASQGQLFLRRVTHRYAIGTATRQGLTVPPFGSRSIRTENRFQLRRQAPGAQVSSR